MIIVVIHAFNVFAQTEMMDVLYLKNGSIIRGTITELVPDQQIKILTADGSLFVYKMAEVEKILKERKSVPKPVDNESVRVQGKSKKNDKQVVQLTPFPTIPERAPLYESSSLIISTTIGGKLYFNDKYLKKISELTIVKFKGVPPGNHTIAVKTPVDSIGRVVEIAKEHVYSYEFRSDSVVLTSDIYKAPQQKRELVLRTIYLSKSRGFTSLTRMGFGFDISSGGFFFSFSTINGYQFTPSFSLGLGVGYQADGEKNSIGLKFKSVPMFASVAFSLSRTRLAPYVLCNFGLNIPAIGTPTFYTGYPDYNGNNQMDVVYGTRAGLFAGVVVGLKIYLNRSVVITPFADISYSSFCYDSRASSEFYKMEVYPLLFGIGLGF